MNKEFEIFLAHVRNLRHNYTRFSMTGDKHAGYNAEMSVTRLYKALSQFARVLHEERKFQNKELDFKELDRLLRLEGQVVENKADEPEQSDTEVGAGDSGHRS